MSVYIKVAMVVFVAAVLCIGIVTSCTVAVVRHGRSIDSGEEAR